MTADREAASLHQAAGFGADVSLNDNFAAGHAMANEIQAITGAFKPHLFAVPRPYAEHLSNINTVTRGGEIDALDLVYRLAGEQVWDKRRQIEPLIRPLAQCEYERLHGSSSFK
jgi:hypothetical protein